MSEREDAIEAMQVSIAQDRVDAAAAWDEEGPPGDSPTLRHGKDILGDAIVEALSNGPAIGPIEFQGKEDYIRGEDGKAMAPGATACLRGCDIVGLVPEFGSRKGYDLLGAAPVSFSTAMRTAPATTQRTAVRNISQSASATQGHTQFQLAKSPLGRKTVMAVIPRTARRKSNAVIIANAKNAAKRAAQIADSLDRRVAAAAKKGIHGDGYDLLGALRVARRGAVSKGPKLSPSQVTRLSKDLRAAGKKVGEAATKHETVMATFNAKIAEAAKKTGGKSVGAPTGTRVVGKDSPFDDLKEDPGNSVHMLGDDPFDDLAPADGPTVEIFGELLESLVLGDSGNAEIVGGWRSDDPNSPDYNIWDGPGEPPAGDLLPPGDPGVPGAPGAGPQLYSSGRYPGPDENNYGVGPKPTTADAQKAFMNPAEYDPETVGETDFETQVGKVYATLPRGAVLYDGSRPFGKDDVGSVSYFLGKWGTADPVGGPGNGYTWNNNGWWVYFWKDTGYTNSGKELRAYTGSGGTSEVQLDSIKNNWGPIVGNPSRPAFVNLHYCNDGFFWFRDRAPDWAKQSEILVLYNGMLTEHESLLTEAKANYATQAAADFDDAKTANDETKRRLREDSDKARAADIAAKDAEAQRLVDEREAARLDAEAARTQAQFDEQQYQSESQLANQQAQIDLQQQQAETQAYAAWLQSPEAQQGGGQPQEPAYSGPFDDLYQGENDPGAGTFEEQPSQWKDEAELQAHASQREDFDGDWS